MEIDVETAVCEPNIGPKEQRRRLVAGLIFMFLTFVALTLILTYTSKRWYRLSLSPFYFVVALSFFQVQEKTCVFLARRGMRKIGRLVEHVADQSRAEIIDRQTRRVLLKTFATAIFFTLLTVFL